MGPSPERLGMLQQVLVSGSENLSIVAVFVFLLVTVALAVLAIRERRRARGEVASQVETQVQAEVERLAAQSARIQEETQRHLAAFAEGKTSVEKDIARFREQLATAQQEVVQLAADIRTVRQRVTPVATEEDIEWTSPDALLRLARQADGWHQAADYLARINLDAATSKNLETAGNICRQYGFFAKAIELYREAAVKDPENISARAELLALSAEIRSAERNEALHKLQELVTDTLVEGTNGAAIQSRFFTTLTSLGRFRELADFCESQLKQPLSRTSQSILHRSLAILYEDLGRTADALAHSEEALRLQSDDPALMALCTRLLAASRKYDEAWRNAVRTLEHDPTCARTYIALAEIQEKRVGRAAARDLLKRAVQWADAAEMCEIEGHLRRLAALDELSEIIPAPQPQLIQA